MIIGRVFFSILIGLGAGWLDPSSEAMESTFLDHLPGGEAKDLWGVLLDRRLADERIATFRDRLNIARKDQNLAKMVTSSQELALVLLAADAGLEQHRHEALDLAEFADENAPKALRLQSRLFRGLILALCSRLDDAMRIVFFDPAEIDERVKPLVSHLNAMLASWSGSPEAQQLSSKVQGQRYPFSAIPEGNDWRMVKAAHYLAVLDHYGYAWSGLGLDRLERSVESQFGERLIKAEVEHGVGSEEAWDSAVKLYEFYSLHNRPEAGSVLGAYLNRSRHILTPRQQIRILQSLARETARRGESESATKYLAALTDLLKKTYPEAMQRVSYQMQLARSLRNVGNIDLEIKAYESVERIQEEGPAQFQTRFEVLQALVRLYIFKGDLEHTTKVLQEARAVANQLDRKPELAGGRRYHGKRLELEEISALLEVPSRSNEAGFRLLKLLEEMDSIAPVWSAPANGVLAAIQAAKDFGHANTVEEAIRRENATQVQERAFPVLAKFYLRVNDWKHAEKALEQALVVDLWRNSVCGSQQQFELWEGLTLLTERVGDERRAELWINDWLNCAGASDRGGRQYGAALLEKAQILAAKKDVYGAEYIARRALAVFEKNTFRGDRLAINTKLVLASILQKQQRQNEARDYLFTASYSLIDMPSTDMAWHLLASHALELLALWSKYDESATTVAFAIVQHSSLSHSAAALEAFAIRASLRNPTLAKHVQKRIELQRRLETLRVQFQAIFTEKDVAAINIQQREKLSKEISKVEDVLKATGYSVDSFPAYSELVAGKVVDVAKLTNPSSDGWVLREREALVVFTQTEKELFANVVRRQRADIIRLDLTREKADALVGWIRKSVELESGHPPREFAYDASMDLYRRIWNPLRNILGGVEHVIVVSDGPIGSIPLELLVVDRPTRAGTAIWLDDHVSISYLPSVSSLLTLRKGMNDSRAPKPILVLGPPDLSGTSTEARANLRFREYFNSTGSGIDPAIPCSGKLRPLPGSVTKLSRQLASGLGKEGELPYLASDFTEERFRKVFTGGNLADFRVVAFVTHGLIAGELGGGNNSEPSLVFTPPIGCTVRETDNDGLLTASEVSELSLDADWVLLVACNTASPDGVLGVEPLSGLARAFLYAGARALLVSHWAVDTSATAEFLTHFISLKNYQGQRVEQLREARRRLRNSDGRDSSHPALWASFILIGDGR